MVLGGQVNHNCWNSVAESFVKASYLARLQLKHIMQQSAFLSYVQTACCRLRTVANTGWRLNNRSLNTVVGLLFLISSSVSFGLCVEFVVVTTTCEMSD